MELVIDRVTKQYRNKIAVVRLSTVLRKGCMACWVQMAQEKLH